MSEPQTERDLYVNLIRGLVQSLVARRQHHGGSGLNYIEFTEESQFLSEARAVLAEQDRKDGLPLDPWDPRYKEKA